jgi:hypothetical protein
MSTEIDALIKTLRGVKSQAQYDAIAAVLKATLSVVEGTLSGEATNRSLRAMDLSFDALEKATELTLKLEDVPEAATSKAAEAFKTPPAQFTEGGVVETLKQELSTLTTATAVQEWYQRQATKDALATIVTPALRNEIMDPIRKALRTLPWLIP